jgi:hypothetical protein
VRFSHGRTAKRVACRLVPAPSVAFICRASRKNARQRIFTVRCQTWRTAKTLYRAKCYCAPFAVRPDEKRTAKGLPCVFGPLRSRGFPLCCFSSSNCPSLRPFALKVAIVVGSVYVSQTWCMHASRLIPVINYLHQ